MKRLFTILISSFAVIGLQAQTVPMAIYGDVYNLGHLLSLGEVHVKADTAIGLTPERVGRVYNDNGGYFKVGVWNGSEVTSKIVFYTNRRKDGILKNMHSYPSSSDILTPNVYVRKNIDKDVTWFTMSLPFNVYIPTGIRNAKTGLPLTGRVDPSNPPKTDPEWDNYNFDVQYYDAQKRAETGKHGEDNWVSIPNYDPLHRYSGTPQYIEAGTTFRFFVRFSSIKGSDPLYTNYDIDFVAAAGAADLFEYKDKAHALDYNPVDPALFTPGPNPPAPGYYNEGRVGAFNCDGWNVIGGLNSDDFSMHQIAFNPNANVNIFYIKDDDPRWRPYYSNDMTTVGTLRPYGAIFIKIPPTNPLNPARQTHSNGIQFKKEGNTLDIANPSVVFRSTKDYYADYDLFRIDIKDIEDNSDRDPVYFKFNDEYSKFYKSSEDNIMFSISKNASSIFAWSLAEVENLDITNRLFANALSYKEHEIPLGINIPKAGDYIFNLKHVVNHENPIKEIESVVLWDKDTDIKIELLQSDYYFRANSDFNTEDRFVLFFNSKDVNGLDKMPDLSEPYAYTENNILMVKNLMQGDKVQVYDVSGRAIVFGVASENTFTAPLNQKGIYIVNIKGGKTFKVLNK